MAASLKGNRWYDEYPPMVRAVELMESLPDQYRQHVATAVVSYTREHHLLGTAEELKSVGHHKVLGLIQSKLRRRWYDKDPVLHKAVNNILLMDESNRQNMSYRLVVSLEALETYREKCEQDGTLAGYDDMEQIVAEIFNRSMDDLIAITTGQFTPQERKEETPSKAVVDDDSGMKVSQFFQID